jgi:hypothetical protein
MRGDQFVCFGPQGPEPPRPTDPDPADEGWHDPSADEGRLIHAVVPIGRLAILLGEGCISLLPAAGAVPDDVYRDARRVAETHGGFMLLSARFVVAEQVGRSWESRSGDCRIPQQTRHVLAQQLRRYDGEGGDRPDPEAFVAYERAAQALERDRGNEVVVRDRRFCIARIETVVNFSAVGAHSRPGRSTALMDLASQLPPVVVSKLLGLHISTATEWAQAAGNTRPGYAASVARRRR